MIEDKTITLILNEEEVENLRTLIILAHTNPDYKRMVSYDSSIKTFSDNLFTQLCENLFPIGGFTP